MTPLVRQRCRNHAEREAAARCPDCQRYFCRECVSEHENRVLCASCLAQFRATAAPRPDRFRGFARLGASVLAVLFTWFCFFLIGRGLLAIPTSFHEGTIWKTIQASQK